MKKIIALLTALVLAMSLFTGCKKKEEQFANKESSTSPSGSEVSSSAPPSSAPSSSASASSEDVTEVPAIATIINAGEYDAAKNDELENKEIGWGQGRRMDSLNRPETCDPAQEKYGGNGGLFIMPANEKKMYLTFDEGYEAGFTPQILDALKEKNTPAVFFVTMDYVKRQPELVQRMIDDGHAIGNHSVRHKSMPTLASTEVVEEIIGLHNYMVENFNYQMTLFRPPEGKYSTRTMQTALDLGYKTVLWSYAYKDYDVKNQMGVDVAFPLVSKAAHNGAIYLLHAVSKDNADMLGDLIDDFTAQGFELAKLE